MTDSIVYQGRAQLSAEEYIELYYMTMAASPRNRVIALLSIFGVLNVAVLIIVFRAIIDGPLSNVLVYLVYLGIVVFFSYRNLKGLIKNKKKIVSLIHTMFENGELSDVSITYDLGQKGMHIVSNESVKKELKWEDIVVVRTDGKAFALYSKNQKDVYFFPPHCFDVSYREILGFLTEKLGKKRIHHMF